MLCVAAGRGAGTRRVSEARATPVRSSEAPNRYNVVR